MKKKVFTIFIITLFLLFPSKVYGMYDTAGLSDYTPTYGGTPPHKCYKYVGTPQANQTFVKTAGGGLRYSIVNKDGEMATEWGFNRSYNFLTYDPSTHQNSMNKWTYNSLVGNTSKKGIQLGNYEIKTGNPANDWKSFDALVNQYNSTINNHQEIWELLGARPKENLACKRQSRSDYKNSEYQCFQFFRDITEEKVGIASTINLMFAIKEVYGEDTTDIVNMAKNLCDSNSEVYLIIEPMIGLGASYYAVTKNPPEDSTSYVTKMATDNCACLYPPTSDLSNYRNCVAKANTQFVKSEVFYSYKKGGAFILGTLTDIAVLLVNNQDVFNAAIDDDPLAITTKKAKWWKIDNHINYIKYDYTTGEISLKTSSVSPIWDDTKKIKYDNKTISGFSSKNQFDKELGNGFWYWYTGGGSLGYEDLAVFQTDRWATGMWGIAFSIEESDLCGPTCSYDPITKTVIGKSKVDPTQAATYKEGLFPNLANKYKNVSEFTFDTWDNGGLGCCYTFEQNYSSLISTDPQWKKAYEDYCGGAACYYDKSTKQIVLNKYQKYDINSDVYGIPLSRYVLNMWGAGSTNCCSSLKNEIMNGELQSWKSDYSAYCDKPLDCCPDSLPAPDEVIDDIHNCCGDGPSIVAQTDIANLFCYDSTLQIEGYQKKCNADEWYRVGGKDGKVNDYCTVYCTERVMIEQPEPITAYVGRYFSLKQQVVSTPTTSAVVTGPWLTGFKRCRVLTEWDKWIVDYEKAIKEEAEAYNKFALEAAKFKYFDYATDNINEDGQSHIIPVSYNTTVSCGGDEKSASDHEIACHDVDVPGGGKKCVGGCSDTSDAHCKIDATSKTFSINYKIYFYSGTSEPYYEVKIDDTKHNAANKYYNIMTLVQDPNAKSFNHSPTIVAWNYSDATSSAKSFYNSHNNNSKSDSTHCTHVSVTCSRTCSWSINPDDVSKVSGMKDYQIPAENAEALTAAAKQTRDAAQNVLKQAVQKAASLEDKLSECQDYFARAGQMNESNYKLEPKVKFGYTQTYLGENGEETVEVQFPFYGVKKNGDKYEAKEDYDPCVYSGPFVASGGEPQTALYSGKYVSPDQEIHVPNYSAIYSSVNKYYEEMRTFDINNLPTRHVAYGALGNHLRNENTEYKAEKKFTHDAKYRADCFYGDPGVKKYTLAPSGLIASEDVSTSKYSKKSTDTNFTLHEREYHINSTVYEGTYETHWYITGVGEKGRFDNYINSHGDTCSKLSGLNETVKDGGTLTCKLKVKQGSSITGKCDPVKTTTAGDCHEYEEKSPYLQFKIIDPSNPFPTATKTNDGYVDNKTSVGYAANWTSTEGNKVMDIIMQKAQLDTTYSIDNLYDSYTLNPQTIQFIQNYNSGQVKDGGYSDFTLTCSCPSDSIRTTKDNNEFYTYDELKNNDLFCDKCKSKFLEELEKNNSLNQISPNGKTLNEIRSHYYGW